MGRPVLTSVTMPLRDVVRTLLGTGSYSYTIEVYQCERCEATFEVSTRSAPDTCPACGATAMAPIGSRDIS